MARIGKTHKLRKRGVRGSDALTDKKAKRVTASAMPDKGVRTGPSAYNEGEEVDLVISDKTDLGYKAIINQEHSGILYKNEVFKKLRIGQQLKGYIKKVRDDQKIDLSLHKPGYQGGGDISQAILQSIKDHGGMIAVSDKSPPKEIYNMFGVSKKVFKKAIGALYKRRLITIDSHGIKLA